jgi:putative membrane protein
MIKPWVPGWRREGKEPDYRFSLANERTFLAWIRTALAVLAGSVVLDQFASHVTPQWALHLLAVGLCTLSAAICGLAYCRWRANEIAMRLSKSLAGTRGLAALASFALVAALFLAGALVFGSGRW